ncbi:MAG TPA: glycoside hydrolase family 15 protein [Acidimicrobiales bacterium]|nr:glycoside hydrolase family 15 protein [Acidimicrobiales bacterium]
MSVLIEEYGLVGDTRTAGLVGPQGSVDWLCVPRFDGDPLFGGLVGGAEAGRFRLGPARPSPVVARRYRGSSATLETTWDTGGGRLILTEGMVGEITGRLLPSTLLVRRLLAPDGPVEAVVDFDPRLGEARHRPRGDRRGPVLICSWPAVAVALQATPTTAIEAGRPTTVVITPDQPFTVVLAVAVREPLVYVEPGAAWAALESDEASWQAWCAGVDASLPERDAVVRSLLTLRLLTYSPSAAPVAAPTTSLPEQVGGERNWDYRYAWPRDASIGVGAFLGVGKVEEARRFMAWLLHATRLDRPRLPPLLTLHGKRPAPERSLDGWPGYAGSIPVRVGNGAADQHQLDVYGWVLDAAWLLTQAGEPLYSETWRAMAGFADTVAARWREPDAGVWEIRGDGVHHVHSKLMAWLALDRALRIGAHHRLSARRRHRWATERDALAVDVSARGFDGQRNTFTRSYGSSDVDAALLVLPLLDIEPVESPRVRGTIDAVMSDLGAGGSLLYRYPPGEDGVAGTEGAFLACSFWLVQALAVTGSVSQAAELFHALVALASPLGLYAEEIDPASGRHLGNYPQALTHAALVQAALALRDASWAPAGEPHEVVKKAPHRD